MGAGLRSHAGSVDEPGELRRSVTRGAVQLADMDTGVAGKSNPAVGKHFAAGVGERAQGTVRTKYSPQHLIFLESILDRQCDADLLRRNRPQYRANIRTLKGNDQYLAAQCGGISRDGNALGKLR